MLAFVLAAALDSSVAAMPQPGSYHYEAFSNGKIVGSNTITVSQTPAGTKLMEYGSAHLETGDSKAESTMLLDSNLMLAGYTGNYNALDEQMKAIVTIGDRKATIAAGDDVRSVQLGGSSKGFIILDSAMVSGFFALPAQMRAYKNADTTVLIPGTGSSAFIDVIPDDKPKRPADVPENDASLSFAGEAPFVEWYDPTTLVVDEIQLPGQNLTIRRKH